MWAVERFHFYLFGGQFKLITNHKPLEVIFGPKSKPCSRIERWVLRLQSYNYKAVYKPGKTNIADPLSRLLTKTSTQTTFDESAEHYVNWVATKAAHVAFKMNDIEQASKNDDEIQAVLKGIHENDWTELSLPYKIFERELCFAGNILLRGNRMVMPKSS